MDFFGELERHSLAHAEDLFNLVHEELSRGLDIYWKEAVRILDGSGTRLLDPPQSYRDLKNNFFSMLFLYSYHRAAISEDRRIMYASINQCFRGMVTGCDNILDDEYKKTLETDLPEAGARFRSVVDIMVSDRILFNILLDAAEREVLARNALSLVSALSLHALLRSGAEEAGEEKGVDRTLSPEEVLRLVHHYKTGLLFQAPWQIPGRLEAIPEKNVESMMEALYQIGMGCQIMDDLVDLSRDARKHRHNYIFSLLCSTAGESGRRQVEKIAAGDNPLEESTAILNAFPELKAAASQKAILFLEKGFKGLFDPEHHFLIPSAVSFLSERIGAGLVQVE